MEGSLEGYEWWFLYIYKIRIMKMEAILRCKWKPQNVTFIYSQEKRTREKPKSASGKPLGFYMTPTQSSMMEKGTALPSP
jgi:hypothetical protein